jgi:hypothetical protein
VVVGAGSYNSKARLETREHRPDFAFWTVFFVEREKRFELSTFSLGS